MLLQEETNSNEKVSYRVSTFVTRNLCSLTCTCFAISAIAFNAHALVGARHINALGVRAALIVYALVHVCAEII